MENVWIGIGGIILGLFCIAIGLFDLIERFLRTRRWEWFMKLAEKKVARVYFAVLGVVLIIMGVLVACGVMK